MNRKAVWPLLLMLIVHPVFAIETHEVYLTIKVGTMNEIRALLPHYRQGQSACLKNKCTIWVPRIRNENDSVYQCISGHELQHVIGHFEGNMYFHDKKPINTCN